ncbi:uncharacterized protein [Lepeophtheirus salmonis]|uniref:uncharacterized protein isoform X1 n=1 Tax=Lepeophtheirus salmonis TaxID=72036 RepID=UPI001AE7D4BE|nr:uncharacterized protein LOC121125546 isoform X1 [Lepeophtheirus salmonis]
MTGPPHPFGVPEEMLFPVIPQKQYDSSHQLIIDIQSQCTDKEHSIADIFDERVLSAVRSYVTHTSFLTDDDLTHQASLVQKLFSLQKEFLRNASDSYSVPNASGSGPRQADLINQIRIPKKSSSKKQYKALYELIQTTISAAGWIIKDTKPVEFLQEQRCFEIVLKEGELSGIPQKRMDQFLASRSSSP